MQDRIDGNNPADPLRELRHDLRTPVNAVLGLSQLLLDEIDGPLGAEQRLQVQLIQDAARSLSTMIDTHLRRP
jgi:signal transduction histidine kinase